MKIFRVRYRIIEIISNGKFMVQFRLFFLPFYSDVYGYFDTINDAASFIKRQRSERVVALTDKEI